VAIGANTLGLFRPGSSVVHRAPPAAKLLALLGLGIASAWLQQRWWAVLIALGGVLVGYLAAGFSAWLMLRQLRPMAFILLFTAAMHVWVADWQRAVAVATMIAALVAMAALITLTTPMTALVDVLVRAAGPLRRFGVDPERVGLILLLGVRCVPVVTGIASQVRQAQIARGAARSYRAFAVPLLVRAIRDAEAIGEALVARGFAE
jgi:biotin transport system permease protein